MVGAGDDPRRLDPTDEVHGNFAHAPLLAGRQTTQEVGLAAIPLVKRHPIEVQTMGHGAVVHFQGDLPPGTVSHAFGDSGFVASVLVLGPGPAHIKFPLF
jgi:hypothetical protein